jgi:hypothetical protein
MLSRNASAPALSKVRIISGVALAGPKVARMRTLRLRGTNWLGDLLNCCFPAGDVGAE